MLNALRDEKETPGSQSPLMEPRKACKKTPNMGLLCAFIVGLWKEKKGKMNREEKKRKGEGDDKRRKGCLEK